jgi:hypothetical protein
MKNALLWLAALPATFATLTPCVAAGDVIIEATGTVFAANASASSAFNGAQVGDPVLVHLEVMTPGMDVAPGQFTTYMLDAAASYVEVGGVRDALTDGQGSIQNDFPVADGIRMFGGPMASGGSLSLDVSESTGTLFGSTDITMELGTWPSTTWASYMFGIFGGGNFIEFSLPDVTITLPSAGTNYCGPAPLNSSGASAEISSTGTSILASNDLGMLASGLPALSFGFFIVSDAQGFAMNPGGSQGNLCVSGDVGRFIDQIQSSGTSGTMTLTVDLTAIPQPTGPVAATVGERWNFQCWFRDANPQATSNFTDGIEVVLE